MQSMKKDVFPPRYRLLKDDSHFCARPTCRWWISDFPRKPQRRGLLVGDSPSPVRLLCQRRGLPRFYPPASRSMDFFLLPICGRRPDSPSVRVTSSQHPRISSANLFMDGARGGTARIVYRRHNAMYSYAARTGKRRTYS